MPEAPIDEASMFTAALRRARLCLRCAAIKSDILEERLVTVIQRVQREITVMENVETCDRCERRTVVYRLH
jgi:uncharacterized protein with PIN domain